MMQEADSDLLLTDYLLNFEDEDPQECSAEGEDFLSGAESSENDDNVTLSSLTKSPKSDGKKPAKTTTKTSDKPANSQTSVEKKRPRDYSREYRLRKSRRDKFTEEECKQLKETNKALNDKNVELDDRVSSLEKQVEYLESVIANASALSAVLGVIKKHSGLSFQKNPLQMNSLKRKRVDNNNVNDENVPQKKHSNGGVCLHLTPGRMSLEFCRECDLNAADE